MAFELNGTEPIGTFSLLTEGRLMSCFNETNVGLSQTRLTLYSISELELTIH